MNAYLNYFIEANVSLALFLGAYLILLRGEHNFTIQRIFLLLGIVMSLTFPLLHLQFTGPALPSLSQIMPAYFLPEVVVTANSGESAAQPVSNSNTIWFYFQFVYVLGLLFFFIRFVVRFTDLIMFLKKSKTLTSGKLKIVEFEEAPTFSFFHFIVLGQAKSLSSDEKQKVLHHEAIHAHQFHSLDILLINLLGIFFWFNPLLKTYKKIFVQLHEFEADARAVENRDVNEYCNLLAKVALESAGFKLANHFNSSLTLKRIEMMKTIKKKLVPWKMLLVASIIPAAFLIVACQDQLTSEVTEMAEASTMAIDIPQEVQRKYDELKKAYPEMKLLLVETDENLTPKLNEMKAKFERLDQSQISYINVITPTVDGSEPVRTFAIVTYRENVEASKISSNIEGDVFSVVDETATPKGGMGAFFEHVGKKLSYPLGARQKGIQGKVFVEFIVNTDGSLDVTGVSGIGAGCDLEAMRVVQTAPKWIPGKNNGTAVRQLMTLPITFLLDGPGFKRVDQPKAPEGALHELVVVSYK